MRTISRDLRANERIRAREVRLIGQEGEQLGVVQLREALSRAQEAGVDLVEVAPTARPPVCRLMDFGRFKYEQAKREREARKKQRSGGELKEVKMRPNIDDHDFDFKARNGYKFLNQGNKLKVTVMFRGREIVHQDIARALMTRFAEVVADVGTVERPPKTEGRNMVMIIMPKPAKAREEAKAKHEAGAQPESEVEAEPEGGVVAEAENAATEAGGGEAGAAKPAATEAPKTKKAAKTQAKSQVKSSAKAPAKKTKADSQGETPNQGETPKK